MIDAPPSVPSVASRLTWRVLSRSGGEVGGFSPELAGTAWQSPGERGGRGLGR